jgi:probable sporulation protein (polysaccharide deacetylase family)
MDVKNKFLSNFIIGVMVSFVLCVSFFLPQSVFPVGVTKVPIYKGTSESKVSLMVNVYWGTEYVESMLDVFDSYEIKTTFFLGGSWVEKNHDVAREIVARGHEVGNHGYFHKDHKTLNKSANKNEIENCHKIVKAVLGVDMNLFAPPSGSFSANTLDIAEEIGYNTIMWSLDTIDWRDNDVSLIVKRATEKACGGDLILMHTTKETLEALPTIIDKLLLKGLTVAKVSEVL